MDHQSAQLIELNGGVADVKEIVSKFTTEAKSEIMHKGESHAHNKEQHQQAEYYNEIADVIKKYHHVILFGPTQAKTELANILKANHLFSEIKIEVTPTDKLTENERQTFVKEYFL